MNSCTFKCIQKTTQAIRATQRHLHYFSMATETSSAAIDKLGGKRRVLLCNLEQVVQVSNSKRPFLAGAAMQSDCVTLQRDPKCSSGCSIVIDSDNGTIEAVGSDEEVLRQFSESQFEQVHKLPGCSVLPGFVDAHTHALFAGDRVREFIAKVNKNCREVH